MLWPHVFSPPARSASTVQQGIVACCLASEPEVILVLPPAPNFVNTRNQGGQHPIQHHRTKTPPSWDRPHSQGCTHPQPPRAQCRGQRGPQTNPSPLTAMGRFPPHPYPCFTAEHHHHLCPTAPVVGLSPEGTNSRPLGLQGELEAGRAGRQGWGSSGEEWAQLRPRSMFSDYKISVFLFKVLSVNIPYYKSSTTVLTDCQY